MSDGFGSGLTTSRYPGDAKSKGHFSYSIGVRDRHRLPIAMEEVVMVVVVVVDHSQLEIFKHTLSQLISHFFIFIVKTILSLNQAHLYIFNSLLIYYDMKLISK